MTEVEKKLMAARALTQTTGVMHDLQVLMIKNWGALAFSVLGKPNWVAIPDPTTKTVTYKVDGKNFVQSTTKGTRINPMPKELPQYVASLDNSIHWLLGDDWATDIDYNGKPLYRGQRTKKKTNEDRKRRAKSS